MLVQLYIGFLLTLSSTHISPTALYVTSNSSYSVLYLTDSMIRVGADYQAQIPEYKPGKRKCVPVGELSVLQPVILRWGFLGSQVSDEISVYGKKKRSKRTDSKKCR